MKLTTLFSTALLSFATLHLHAQMWGSGGTNTYTTEKVGINATSAPSDAWLHIHGQEYSTPCPGGMGISIYNPLPELWIERPVCGGCLLGCATPPSANILQISQGVYGMGGSYNNTLDVINAEGWLGVLQANPTAPLDVNGSAHIGMNAIVDGYARIGTASSFPTPPGYSLYVSKGILAERVKVAKIGTPDWADFVFADNYQLPTLGSVGAYIHAHRHLPGIPSAEEVATDGLDLAQMDAKLLQKVEELTLYALQQQQQIEELRSEIANMKKKN